MGRSERIVLYNELENLRKKPLIAYVTSIRPNMSAQMAGDAVTPIIEQVQKIPESEKEVDFLIISNGGDPITALRIISILRERFEKISVLVPYVAYSAATILALGADEIVMHPFSNLGPVDPQLSVTKNDGMGQQANLAFSSEDLRNYIDFVKNDVGITDQAYLVEALKSLASEVGVLPIGSAKRSQQLSLSLSSKMLETHMSDKTQAASIAKTLNSSYYHHGYAVGRTEAKNIGLNVIKPDKQVEDLIWTLWEDFRKEMKCNTNFDIFSELFQNPEIAERIQNVPVIELPANTPPELAQQILINQAQQVQASVRSSIEIEQLMATIESRYISFSIYNRFNTIYWRNADMSLGFNATAHSAGWELVEETQQASDTCALKEAAATLEEGEEV